MINIQAVKYIKVKEIIGLIVFVSLSVFAPWFIHLIGGVGLGRLFLPMPFFTLMAGLLLGWRAGLATGLLSPIISHTITGMPLSAVLPFITIELTAYGLMAGLLNGNFKINVIFSLLGAMFLGRILLGLSILLFSINLNAVSFVWGALKAGWPGIIIQIIFLPVLVKIFYRYLNNDAEV